MRRNTLKTMAICALIIGVGGLTLGYAALTQVLNVSTTAKVQNSNTSWNVLFEELRFPEIKTTGNAIGGEVTLTDTTVTLSGVVLTAPGDSVEYNFAVVNHGEIDAKLSSFVMKTPTITGVGDTKTEDENLVKSAYEYKITYDDGSVPTADDVLDSGGAKSLKLIITLKADVANLPTGDVTIDGLGATFTYVQK